MGIPREKVVVYETTDGWRYKAKAGNNRTVGMSEEAHGRKQYQVKKAHKLYPELPIFIQTSEGLIPE